MKNEFSAVIFFVFFFCAATAHLSSAGQKKREKEMSALMPSRKAAVLFMLLNLLGLRRFSRYFFFLLAPCVSGEHHDSGESGNEWIANDTQSGTKILLCTTVCRDYTRCDEGETKRKKKGKESSGREPRKLLRQQCHLSHHQHQGAPPALFLSFCTNEARLHSRPPTVRLWYPCHGTPDTTSP